MMTLRINDFVQSNGTNCQKWTSPSETVCVALYKKGTIVTLDGRPLFKQDGPSTLHDMWPLLTQYLLEHEMMCEPLETIVTLSLPDMDSP